MVHGTLRCVHAPGQPADWTFVIGQGFFVALPASTSAAVLEKLSDQTDRPVVQLETLVALLPLAGEHKIESFIVVVPGTPVDDDGVPVSIVVKGEIAAEVFSVGGSRRFSDQDIRPWLLAEFQAVVGIDIVPLSAGASTTVADRRQSVPIGIGTISGTSLIWSLTDVRTDDISTRRAGASGVEPAAAGTWFGLRLPAGDERRIDSVFLLGRRPRQQHTDSATRTDAHTERITLIPLASPTSAVSATHLEIRLDGERVVVTDLNSTNGSTLTHPDGRRDKMRPGTAVVAVPGTTVDVGDGNIIEILPASER